MQTPFDMHCQLYGKQRQSKPVFYITCALGIVVTLAVFGGWLAMVPHA